MSILRIEQKQNEQAMLSVSKWHKIADTILQITATRLLLKQEFVTKYFPW